MAIALEELALGALEASAGPWTLAVGAGALAVALAAGSVRPFRRMATTGAFAAQRTGQLSLRGWIGSVRQNWLDLVDEARTEYDAARQSDVAAAPIVLQAVDRAEPVAAPVTVADAPVTRATAPPPMPAVDNGASTGKRDQRGRFVRRAVTTNGTQSE